MLFVTNHYEYKFLMMPKYNQTKLLQETFKVKQTEIASRLIQGQTNKMKALDRLFHNELLRNKKSAWWVDIASVSVCWAIISHHCGVEERLPSARAHHQTWRRYWRKKEVGTFLSIHLSMGGPRSKKGKYRKQLSIDISDWSEL